MSEAIATIPAQVLIENHRRAFARLNKAPDDPILMDAEIDALNAIIECRDTSMAGVNAAIGYIYDTLLSGWQLPDDESDLRRFILNAADTLRRAGPTDHP